MAKRVVLDAKLDTAAAEGLRETLLASQGDDLTLDGRNVEHLGGLCLELLLSARHLWGIANKTVCLETPSVQMIDDLSRFGLSDTDFQGRPA